MSLWLHGHHHGPGRRGGGEGGEGERGGKGGKGGKGVGQALDMSGVRSVQRSSGPAGFSHHVLGAVVQSKRLKGECFTIAGGPESE